MSNNSTPEIPKPTEAEIDAMVTTIMGGNAVASSMHEQIISAAATNTLDQPDANETHRSHVPTIEELVKDLDNSQHPDASADEESDHMWAELDGESK